MKCKNCGETLKAEVAITEQGWIIFHECITRGDTEEKVIENFNNLLTAKNNIEVCRICGGEVDSNHGSVCSDCDQDHYED